MHYRTFGNTGKKVSILGFGCMRLPTIENKEETINQNEAIRLIRKGIDAGINYIDTAYNYHHEESEIVVGKALKDGYRERVILATKAPVGNENYSKPNHFEEFLNRQLKKLAVDYVDVYLFHGLNAERWQKVKNLNLIQHAEQAKKDGLIKYLAFSFHDKPEALKEIIDSKAFDAMLVQYSILDTSLEEMITYAAKNGLGICVMGPIGGGRLAGDPPEKLLNYLSYGEKNFVALALKYVWSNPKISVALSGMGSDEMVSENLKIASGKKYTLTAKELNKANELGKKFKELADIVCTGCKYCEPCQNGVNISFIFRCLINYEIYNQKERAKHMYSRIGKENWAKGEPADSCTECGECLKKCPQNIDIIKQLKEAHQILSK